LKIRSLSGSITAITEWLYSTDHQQVERPVISISVIVFAISVITQRK